jgi:tetratricopeptide (TPR) repeat protein
MKGMKAGIVALMGILGVAGVAVAPQAYAKKKSTKSERAAQAAAEAASTKSAKASDDATAQAAKSAAPKLAKPGQGQSMPSQSTVGGALGDADTESLVGSSGKQALRPATQVEAATRAVDEMKKKTPTLSLGVFRSENLSGGQVNAPGIADFAAYFRAASDGEATAAASQANAKPGATKPGAAKGKDAGVRDGAFTQEHVQLGAATTDQLARQAQAERLRSETAESIRKILQTNPSNDQKVDLQMRLAEIQIERHAYLLELEIKEFNEAHDKWKVTRKGSEPVFKTDRSTAQLLAAIAALRTVVTSYPNHARAPEALFTLGFMLSQMNSDSSALYFERLVKNYPKSEYVPDAHLALAEWHFSKLAWTKAQQSYQKVLNYKGTRAYPYAVYKLGWTYFNLTGGKDQQNLVKSLAAFKLVVKLADSDGADKTVKGLRKEALKDMVLVFAEIGDVTAAQRYFESLGEQELYFTLLERLAWQNTEAGKYAESATIYQRLVREAPLSPRLPAYHGSLASLYEKQQQRGQLIKTLQGATQLLADDSEWMRKNGKDPQALKSRNELLGRETLTWAQRFHQDAQKLKREQGYDEAMACYDIYVERYGETKDAYAARFYRAEIYAHKGKLLEASDEYMRAVALDEKFKINGKHTRDAIINAVVAVDSVLAKSTAPKLPEAGKAASPIPLTAMHARLVKALDAFARIHPTDADTLAMSHRAAGVVYAFGDYKGANERWSSITKQHPKSKEAYEGARLVVKVPVDRQDWPTAIAQARKFLGYPGVKETKLGDELTAVLKGSVFQHALALEKQDKRAEAATLFLAYHKEFQSDADAPKALFNAANNKFRLGKMDEAIAHLQTLIAQYPKSDLSPNVLYLIASSYDALGQFAESAQNYEQLASENPKLEAAPESLLRATVQRNAIGDSDKAVRNAGDFIQAHPTHKDVGLVWAQLGMAHSKRGDDAMAHKTLTQGAEAMARSKATDAVLLYGMAAQAALKGKDKAAAQKTVASGTSLHASIGDKAKDPQAMEGARLLGETQLAILDEQVTEIYKNSITDSLKLTEQFSKVRDEVQGLAQKYVAIAKLGNAESGIGALYRVAEMQEFLANMLLKAPLPTGATAAETEQFRGTLERIALPLQEEATSLYAKAWERASETEAVTPFTRRLHEKLAVLRPGDFSKIVEEMPAPSYYSSDVVMTRETKAVFKD